MAKQTFTTGQVLTAAQQNSLQSNDFNQTVSVKTANYSLLAADKGTRIEFNTSGSVTCTVNSGQFDAGDTLIIQNRGAGTATITAGTATVNTSASLALTQYSAGTLYFVSDSAALFFGDAAGISASLIDAKGDLIVGTADNTVGRLAVGTNGYTLVADSSTATGLAYAAPADGGYTSLASGSLSGALAITSISGAYEDLVLILRDPYPATDESLFFRANNNSTSEAYQWNELANSADATAATYSGTETFMRSQAGNWNNADANCFVIARYYDYANTSSVKNIQISQFYRNDNNTYFIRSFINGYWNDTAAITQVNAYFGNINFSGGTYELFGVK